MDELDFWKSNSLLMEEQTPHTQERRTPNPQFIKTPEEGKNFKARAKELMERQKRERDTFYAELSAASENKEQHV